MGFAYVKSAAAALNVGLLLASVAVPGSPAAQKHDTSTAPPVAAVGRVRFQGEWTPSGSALFRGIPYAQPPMGALRWKPPQPVTLRPGARAAVQAAPTCLQAFVGWNRMEEERSAEDCLYLDIRTPRIDRKARLPVLVWIHGGANWAGSGSWAVNSGLADRGIVVVAVQYRLGIFGSLSHPELTREAAHAAGNFALLDQIAALDWVRRNIASFGGNPAAVTIAGQSGGAQDVALLLLSPRARGLFARAIQQSGTAAFGLRPRTLAENEELGQRFAHLAGAPADGALEALRAVAGRRLLEAQMLLESPTLSPWPAYGSQRAYLGFTQSGPEARTALRAPICGLLQRP